jgi:hypothetical protein
MMESCVGGKTYDIIKSMYTRVQLNTFLSTGLWGETKMQLEPHSLQRIYINKLAKPVEQSAAPSLTLLESEVKCLLFANDLVLLSPTKEGLEKHLDLLHRFYQTWVLTVNLSRTKNNGVPKMSICQYHKYKFYLDTVALEHTKKYTYLSRNISTTGNFHKAVNNLRDKARRAFYAVKRNIKFDIPIRIWIKILQSFIEPISLYGCEVWGLLTNKEFRKWDKHQIETLHEEFNKCMQIRLIPANDPNPEKRRSILQPPKRKKFPNLP